MLSWLYVYIISHIRGVCFCKWKGEEKPNIQELSFYFEKDSQTYTNYNNLINTLIIRNNIYKDRLQFK